MAVKVSRAFYEKMGRYVHGKGFHHSEEFLIDEQNNRVRWIKWYRKRLDQLYWAVSDKHMSYKEAAYRISQLEADGYGQVRYESLNQYPTLLPLGELRIGTPFNFTDWCSNG